MRQRRGTSLHVEYDREELPEYWDGKKVGSKEEGRIIKMALQYGWKPGRWIFQHPINGGRLRRGGQVLDFVFFADPNVKIVFVNGGYWHAADGDELARQREAKRVMGESAQVYVVWDHELITTEMADTWFGEKVGYP